jgi:hypothetical protein
MQRSASRLLSVVLLYAVLAITVFAQVPTGRVRGVVTDPSKAVVAGATVTVTNKGTGLERRVTTNADGEYQVGTLPPGEYEIKVTMSGFKTYLTIVTIQVGENITSDAMLEIGQTSETVVVAGETPAINTTDHKIDGVVNRKQIESLPLNGRNFLQLALLEPGVTVEATDNPGPNPNNFFRVSIAGAGQALTRISVDGATINDRVTGGTAQNFSQETVQEFQISTFNFDLSTSVTGVGSINVVSRSGTNDLHGSAFIYYRDHNIAGFPSLQRDPRRFTNPGLDDPFFARRQVGGSLGGPIKKDKLFWFFNFERNNQDGVVPVANNHPIWSKFDTVAPQPLTFTQANIKFDWKVNEKHNAFLRFSSDNNDNFNADGGSFLPSHWVATENTATQALAGLTSVLNPRLVNDLRYSYGFYSGRLNIPTTNECQDLVACIGLGGPQIRTTLASQFRIGNNLNTPQNRVLRTYQLTDTLSWRRGSHGLRFGGEWEHFYGLGHWAFLEPALEVLWDPVHIAQFAAAVPAAFGPLYNALPASLRLNATGTAPLNSAVPTYAEILQLPLFSFLTGVGDPGQPQSFRQPSASRNDRVRFFMADQWRVKSNFTLNYGLAWAYEDNILNYDLDRPAILGQLLGGDLRPPRHDRNNFGPSLGFAWDVRGNGKTVIRGGSGIYHDSNLFWTRLNERAYIGPSGNGRYIIPGSVFGLEFASTPTAFTATNLAAQLPALRSAITAALGNGKDLSVRGVETLKTTGEPAFGTVYDPNTVVPYSMNFSGGIQREIAPNLVVQADFVMRRSVKFGGLHALFFVDRNRFNRARLSAVDPVTGRGNSAPNPIIPLCTTAQAADPKAICSRGALAVSHSGANFRYTGLHVKVDKRFSNRYLFVASYALSKYTGFNGVINYDNFYEADDYQGADRRHRFTFSGVMELPTYTGESRFLRGLANSWSVSLISQMVSTPPLETVITGVDHDGDGISTLILPGATFRGFGRGLSKNRLRELVDQYNKTFRQLAGNGIDFKRTTRDQVIPAITLPANFDSGDTFFSQDVRLTRSIRFTEQAQLQLIGEVFNLFNISNLTGYSGTLNGPNFGQPSRRAGGVFGTGGPRAFQFAARFTF